MSDEEKRACIDRVARILAKCEGWEQPTSMHTEQASRVFAYVVGPAIAEREAERSSRQAWAEEAMRLDEENERLLSHMRPVLVSGGPNMEVCYGVAGKPGDCTSRSAHLFGCPDSLPQCTVHPEGGA